MAKVRIADRAHCAEVYDRHMAIYYANTAISLVEVESLRPGMLRNAVPTDKAWYAERIKDVFDIDGKW